MSVDIGSMIPGDWRRYRAVAVALLVYGMTGCQMLVTVPLHDAAGVLCKSAAGAYFLPKKLISFKIKQQSDNATFEFDFGGVASVADRERAFCLDYLGSPFSEDTIHVEREDGLLKVVGSVAEDKSKEIAEKLIEIGVIGATGNPNFAFRRVKTRSGSDLILADYSFDPFDREQLAEVNAAQAPTYGYCVIIEGHTVAPADYQSYCDNPRGGVPSLSGQMPVYKAPPGVVTLPPLAPEIDRTGILYRPNLTHQLIIMRRRDPGLRKPWELFQTTRVEMPNLAPVFSIGVERSAFVKRTTRLDFDAGVLKDITIEKPSELVEFMEIPLVLAQALVKIPAEVIKVRLASTSNQKLLIDAQRELLATQRAYAETVQGLQDKAAFRSGNRSLDSGGRAGRSGAADTSGLARALLQISPARLRRIDDVCSASCFEPACTLQTCRSIAATFCEGQEPQVCLPPRLPQ